MTRKCNLRCRHCYLSAGPEHSDTTISRKDFKKIINNLPKSSVKLWLTGGEIFTLKDTLFDYLECIQKENHEREIYNQGKIFVGLQTNASWAKNDNKIKKTLTDIVSFGVKGLDITSKDKYHRDQGIKTKNLNRLYDIIKKDNNIKSHALRGALRRDIMPVGRAKEMNLGKPVLNYKKSICKDALTNYRLTIQEDGGVYMCCFAFFPLPGNLIEEPLVDIVRKAKEDERLHILDSKGIKGLARHDGWKKRDIEELISAYGKCGFCYQYYKPENL